MRKFPLALAVTVAILALSATPAIAAQDKDCKDFSTQAAAQAFFVVHGGSPSNNVDNLDADHDGKACEALPSGATSGATSPAPTGQATAGNLPRTGPSGMLAPLGGALVLIGGLAVHASRRRRRALR